MTHAWRQQFNLREANRKFDELERETIARIRSIESPEPWLKAALSAAMAQKNFAMIEHLSARYLRGNIFEDFFGIDF